MLSRRVFLASSSAIAAAHLIPTLPATASPAPAVTAAVPKTTIWVGGHDGEFDWSAFHAESEQDAMRQLMASWGDVPEPGETLDDLFNGRGLMVQRAPPMDGLLPNEIKPADWISSGLGACCDRCGSECFPENGARAVAGEAVCEECVTIPDLLDGDDYDVELAEERLSEWFINHDCDEASVRKQMSSSFDPDLIPTDIWQKCLAEARAEL